MILECLYIFGLVSSATLMGSMVFFSGVMAPLIFIKLDEGTAGQFVRSIFPWYYLVIAGMSLIGSVSLVIIQPLPSAILAVIAIAAFLARQVLMPRINEHRAKMVGGDNGAERAFQRLHSFSVWINNGQLIGSFTVLIMLGLAKF
ncbi:MAG: DUF4149 domain-containing protein [Rhodospirillales bacterium]|nr:DUF4149 domain-containing protein [Rhodospirillales bacterium]